jgi:hypothetical protein
MQARCLRYKSFAGAVEAGRKNRSHIDQEGHWHAFEYVKCASPLCLESEAEQKRRDVVVSKRGLFLILVEDHSIDEHAVTFSGVMYADRDAHSDFRFHSGFV